PGHQGGPGRAEGPVQAPLPRPRRALGPTSSARDLVRPRGGVAGHRASRAGLVVLARRARSRRGQITERRRNDDAPRDRSRPAPRLQARGLTRSGSGTRTPPRGGVRSVRSAPASVVVLVAVAVGVAGSIRLLLAGGGAGRGRDDGQRLGRTRG